MFKKKKKNRNWREKKKETINKTKWEPSEWEKAFANKGTGKGLISKIYKHLRQLNIKATNNIIKNRWEI